MMKRTISLSERHVRGFFASRKRGIRTRAVILPYTTMVSDFPGCLHNDGYGRENLDVFHCTSFPGMRIHVRIVFVLNKLNVRLFKRSLYFQKLYRSYTRFFWKYKQQHSHGFPLRVGPHEILDTLKTENECSLVRYIYIRIINNDVYVCV